MHQDNHNLGFELYNAADDLIDRNVSGHRSKTAIIDDSGVYTYSDLAELVNRFVTVLRELGLEHEHRIVLCLLDSIDFPVSFLGAIKAGVVPIPLNTSWTESDYAYTLADSRARAAVVSDVQLPVLLKAAQIADWKGQIIVSGDHYYGKLPLLRRLLDTSQPERRSAPTRSDDVCFWLYSSGSTGKPKGTVHLQSSLVQTAKLFAQGVLGMHERDVVYSAAKLFFAYGLGNALTFPFSVGGTSVLTRGRATPSAVNAILRERQPTIFCGVPTLFSSLLVAKDLIKAGEHRLKFCTSAGEALPERVGWAWKARTGVNIVEGLGSTEMLHIFISNRPGSVRYGTTGRLVSGYTARIVDENQRELPPGEIGDLHVAGPTMAAGYWNNSRKTRGTFLGEWMRTGDKFRQNADGDFIFSGRADEMLKVGGIWVSPVEVEAALVDHDSVQEAAVAGALDENGLVKPKAFIVLKPGFCGGPELTEQLQQFIKTRLAPYKYPRWIEFVSELPKTATGKTQRYLLQDERLCRTQDQLAAEASGNRKWNSETERT
jgi:benzoate-CoA ligase